MVVPIPPHKIQEVRPRPGMVRSRGPVEQHRMSHTAPNCPSSFSPASRQHWFYSLAGSALWIFFHVMSLGPVIRTVLGHRLVLMEFIFFCNNVGMLDLCNLPMPRIHNVPFSSRRCHVADSLVASISRCVNVPSTIIIIFYRFSIYMMKNHVHDGKIWRL